jgi:hypothetical protein
LESNDKVYNESSLKSDCEKILKEYFRKNNDLKISSSDTDKAIKN